MLKRLMADYRKPTGSIVRNASGPVTISLIKTDPKHLTEIITPRVMSDSRAALKSMRAQQAVRQRPDAGA